MRNRRKGNAGFGNKVVGLGADGAAVVRLRLARIARGGDAGKHEAKLMVTEKLAAIVYLLKALLTGGLGTGPRTISEEVLDYLGEKVRANRRRLGG